MARTRKFWGVEEFVSYDEYASFGISGEMRDRNMERSFKKGLDWTDMCPLCMKELKEGSYVIMWVTETENCNTQYRFNPNANGIPTKVGLGCFRNLMKAYKDKYGK